MVQLNFDEEPDYATWILAFDKAAAAGTLN